MSLSHAHQTPNEIAEAVGELNRRVQLIVVSVLPTDPLGIKLNVGDVALLMSNPAQLHILTGEGTWDLLGLLRDRE